MGQGWLTVGREAEDDDAEYSLHGAQREDESVEHVEDFLGGICLGVQSNKGVCGGCRTKKGYDFAINICSLTALGGVMMRHVPRMTYDVCAAGEATI